MNSNPSTRNDVRRHPNGSIDFDFYRARAIALRGQAMRDAFKLKSAGAGFLALVGALAVTILFAATPARGHSDLKFTDSTEREIERRLLFDRDQKFR